MYEKNTEENLFALFSANSANTAHKTKYTINTPKKLYSKI